MTEDMAPTIATNVSPGGGCCEDGSMPETSNPGTSNGVEQASVPPGLLRDIDHIGIAVHDLDAAIAMYTETYGLRLLHVEDNPDQGVREAMLGAGDTGGTAVQLVAPLGDDSPVARFLSEHKPGLHHLAFAVEDIEDAATQLRDSGVEVLYDDKGRPGTGDSRVNFVHPRQAGGALLELVEHRVHACRAAPGQTELGPRSDSST